MLNPTLMIANEAPDLAHEPKWFDNTQRQPCVHDDFRVRSLRFVVVVMDWAAGTAALMTNSS
jgi:hypothetical protein